MRTTLTLDPDVAAMLKKAVAGGKSSFKDVVNAALRAGLQSLQTPTEPKKRWVQRSWPNGGSEYLVPPERWKDLLEQEDVERFLEVGRRQSTRSRD